MYTLASFSIESKQSLETCFSYLSNMENFGNWFPKVIKIKAQDSTPIGIGKEYLETVKIPIMGFKQVTLTVKGYEQNMTFSTEGDLALLMPRMDITLSNTVNNITNIHWIFSSRNPSPLFKLISPFIKGIMGKRARIAAINLSSVLNSSSEKL